MSNLHKRALALSGGGGRGAYHVGVYKYLEEQGVQPDVVVGASIGAVNGQTDYLIQLGYTDARRMLGGPAQAE